MKRRLRCPDFYFGLVASEQGFILYLLTGLGSDWRDEDWKSGPSGPRKCYARIQKSISDICTAYFYGYMA